MLGHYNSDIPARRSVYPEYYCFGVLVLSSDQRLAQRPTEPIAVVQHAYSIIMTSRSAPMGVFSLLLYCTALSCIVRG